MTKLDGDARVGGVEYQSGYQQTDQVSLGMVVRSLMR